MTARTRKQPAAAKTTAAATTGNRCEVPDCIPGLHGPVEDGLCPVHRQTHPGLSHSAMARKDIVQADELPLGNGRPGPENSGQDADENQAPSGTSDDGQGDNGGQADDESKEKTGD